MTHVPSPTLLLEKVPEGRMRSLPHNKKPRPIRIAVQNTAEAGPRYMSGLFGLEVTG